MMGVLGAETDPANVSELVEMVNGKTFEPLGATSSEGVGGSDIIALAS
jgi:hypothetical protein